ncbi:MAG: alpha/beta hydrolase, partial [Pseudomonadota bacterium]
GLLTQPVSDEVLHLAWVTAMQAGLRPTLAAAKAFATTDFRPDLASFRVPTLIIHGTSDKTVPIDATARAVARAVPHTTLLEYDGEPHGVFATQSDRLIRDILDFVSGRAADDVPQQVVDTLTAQTLVTPTM